MKFCEIVDTPSEKSQLLKLCQITGEVIGINGRCPIHQEERDEELRFHNVPTDEEAPGTRVTGEEPVSLSRIPYEDLMAALESWVKEASPSAAGGDWHSQGLGILASWLGGNHPEVARKFIEFCTYCETTVQEARSS